MAEHLTPEQLSDPADRSPAAGGAEGGTGYGDLVAVLRRVQDAVVTAEAPGAVLSEVTLTLHEAAKALEQFEAPEEQRSRPLLLDTASHERSLIPRLEILEADEDRLVARVRCGAFYLGVGGAAHGGVVSLIFDDVFGRLANCADAPTSRTAALTVNYRSILRIGADLDIECHLVRNEGRKFWFAGELKDGSTVVADAEALFIVPRPARI